jgi:hypothetical protein
MAAVMGGFVEQKGKILDAVGCQSNRSIGRDR